ncbi:AVAST type 4 anti-phage nuclease Avs4 [Arcobacter sp. FWKO B]|uniref:AVAST type 4 anti-phage nuclease Avs4 n=1 Tax=Arcobacter sp. FWKO B TaxID=2593672 RepID=UPI0018A412AB|nr:AVAST type 4 anti-phage nuclease Avs4 [Arcobacter sp. FWKO B]QOG11919.1 ATP-binding protein [Arcobacter sp. FWKO B]
MIIKPNWEQFKSKFNDSPTYYFEYFCYLLFCLEYNKPQGIFRYKNQSGIEWNPIEVDGRIIVAQCKFYDTSLGSHKDEIIEMLTTIQKNYTTPCELKFYTNQDWGQGKKRGTNDSQPKIEIETKAKEYNITIDWRTNETYFLSPDVAFNQELMKHFFTDSSIYDLVNEKQTHTERVLSNIHTQINFNSRIIEIDKTKEINEIKNQLIFNQALILSGTGGTGKTAIIKKLYEDIKNDMPFYLFKASEFETNQIDNLFGQYSFKKFIDIHEQDQEKIIIVDSAEKILDLNNNEPFKEFFQTLIKYKWKVVFTTRHTYLNDLYYHFSQLEIIPFTVNIENLNIEELNILSSGYEFNLPQDEKLLDLVKNPFYLNEYLSNYSNDEIDYQDFKNRLWNQNIGTQDMAKCFFEIAFKRANEGQFYVDIDCVNDRLKQLQKKGILGYEKNLGYFITHDIYEEWALEGIVNKEFITKSDIKSFFEKIGSSLPMRRAFRCWVSEKLLLDDENIKTFIEEIIASVDIEIFWKDEIFISILLSEYSDTFFKNFKRELLDNDYELLSRISFLLRLACKEVDNSFWESLGLKNQQLQEAKYIFTKPKGTGWKSFINFVYENIEIIGLAKIDLLLPILQDWNSKFQEGSTTRNASLTALKYYDLINQKEYKYSYDESIKTICKVISSGSFEIKDELSAIFDEIVEKKLKNHNDTYYELSKMILTSWEGLLISNNLPEQVLKLADLFWTKTPRKVKNGGTFPHYERKKVEDAFNLSSKYEFKYFPASALQTPIYFLLKNHFSITIDFILDFINKSVEYYSKSGWEYKEEIQMIDVFVDENITIQQCHSKSLWNIYRGNSSPVMPNLMQSIHMALEKYLLEISKILKTEDLEFWLLYLLQKSKSSSLSAIVASVVLANSDKAFNIAVILFKTKEFIQADFHRQIHEHSIKNLYGIGYGLNWQTQIFQDERLKTCEDKHRNSSLESLFLNYQMFRTSEISEEESEKRQKILWDILDNYYKQLPNEESQSEEDRIWRMALARMDKRKMDIEIKKVDDGVQITFNPKLSPELKKYSQEAQENSQNTIKYTTLYLWSVNKIDNNKDYKKYTIYEENPLLVLEQIKEVIAIPHDKRDFIFQDKIFPHVSIILLRDYIELLSSEDKELCRDIIFEFARLPLAENYHYQVSDGVDKAIKYLPILLIYFPELKNDIKILLLLNLFDDYQIGMGGKHFYDFAIEAIDTYLNKESNSFIVAYLLLKPKYDELIKSNYYGQKRVSKQDLLKNFFQSNEEIFEKFASNELRLSDNEIKTTQLDVLIVAFKMIVTFKSTVEKKFTQKIIEMLCINIFNKTDDKVDYDVKQQFINNFALFILEVDKDVIQFYLQPLINSFKPTEEMASLLTQLIYTQDRINRYDNFWHVWELFENKIIEICKDGDKYSYIDQIIKAYLLASGQYGSLWTETAKEWHSFKEKDKRFIKRISEKIGHCPSSIYSLSKFLTSIGSTYHNDGISWIANMLRNNNSLSTDKLEPDTVFHLENLIRKYVFLQSEKIKKERKTKDDVLIILNFLVEKGSAVAYMLREKVL